MVTCTGLSPSTGKLSRSFQFDGIRMSQSYNPAVAVTTTVWALSSSLAATKEIDVSFFSSSY